MKNGEEENIGGEGGEKKRRRETFLFPYLFPFSTLSPPPPPLLFFSCYIIFPSPATETSVALASK